MACQGVKVMASCQSFPTAWSDPPNSFQNVSKKFAEDPCWEIGERRSLCRRDSSLSSSEAGTEEDNPPENAWPSKFETLVSLAVGFSENLFETSEPEGASHLLKDLIDI